MSQNLQQIIEAPKVRKRRIKKSSMDSSAPTSTHSRRSKQFPKRWSAKETRLFYRGLTLFGTDFSAIASMMLTKSRDQIINKYRKEEKTNSRKIDLALHKHKVSDKRIHGRFDDIFLGESEKLSKSRRNSMLSTDSVDVIVKDNLRHFLGENN